MSLSSFFEHMYSPKTTIRIIPIIWMIHQSHVEGNPPYIAQKMTCMTKRVTEKSRHFFDFSTINASIIALWLQISWTDTKQSGVHVNILRFGFAMRSLTPQYWRRGQPNYQSNPSQSKYLNTLSWISGQLWCSLQIKRGLFGTRDQELNSGMIEGMQFEKVLGEGWIAPHGRPLKKFQCLVTDSMEVGRVIERLHSCRSKMTRCWRGLSAEWPSRCR